MLYDVVQTRAVLKFLLSTFHGDLLLETANKGVSQNEFEKNESHHLNLLMTFPDCWL